MPQLMVSWLTVRGSDENPRIFARGRKRATDRTVNPLCEMQRMAAAPISLAARCAAEVTALVTRESALSPDSSCSDAKSVGQPA